MSHAITIEAVVQGNRIEVPAPPGYAEGQVVNVTLQPVDQPRATLSEGIVKAFGILSPEEGADLDRFLEESRAWQRKEHRDAMP